MSDEIDPEIAALIGESGKGYKAPAGSPDFATLFGDRGVSAEPRDKEEFGVDLTRKVFAPIEKMEEETPADFFSDAEYYKKALGGEGEEAQKVHDILSKYLKATDPKDRGVYRQQLVPAFWYLASKVALRSASSEVILPKRLVTRFGALLPAILSPEIRNIVERSVFEKTSNEPVYYVDEWIRAVATNQIGLSATDEIKPQRGGNDDQTKYTTIIQKAQGKQDASEGIMKAKAEERRNLESLLKGKVDIVCRHEGQPGLSAIPTPYDEQQKRAMSDFSEVFRKMLAVDKELTQTIAEFERAGEELKAATEKAGTLAKDTKTDLNALAQEFEALRQMTKLCIGRQGNHFPILSREYLHGGIRDIGNRENVLKLLAWIENIDSEAYCRPYKNTLNRIVPYIILLPCYGDAGICWEPFDRFNRASSRGRVAIPMYPKNLQLAVVTAVADLRWQVAKEKASYYWMEEGLTGNYYQWFVSKKMRGDVKEFFIQDYIMWITKESEGTQKLDKEVRAIFWRYLPFTKEIKDKLKTRSYIYQELYQKDINRSLSDGY